MQAGIHLPCSAEVCVLCMVSSTGNRDDLILIIACASLTDLRKHLSPRTWPSMVQSVDSGELDPNSPSFIIDRHGACACTGQAIHSELLWILGQNHWLLCLHQHPRRQLQRGHRCCRGVRPARLVQLSIPSATIGRIGMGATGPCYERCKDMPSGCYPALMAHVPGPMGSSSLEAAARPAPTFQMVYLCT